MEGNENRPKNTEVYWGGTAYFGVKTSIPVSYYVDFFNIGKIANSGY
jgi:hypothetical protein